jgi:signal transduction histidine kinase
MSLTSHSRGRTLRAEGRSRVSVGETQANLARADPCGATEQDLLEELRQARELETLVRGLSHHFNDDLHVIGGHAELLSGAASVTQVQASAHTIRSSVLRMERTFKDLLLCALSGQAELSLIDIAAQLTGLRATLEQLEPGGVDLRIEAEYPVHALASEALLMESLVHLVRNGIEATLRRPAHIRIRCGQIELGYEELLSARPISNARPGSYAYIEVCDEGRGISAAELERIFDPFLTSKPLGRGLGLPRVLCNVRRMGGLITLRSAPREGTRVRLFLQTGAAGQSALHDDGLPLSALFAGC